MKQERDTGASSPSTSESTDYSQGDVMNSRGQGQASRHSQRPAPRLIGSAPSQRPNPRLIGSVPPPHYAPMYSARHSRPSPPHPRQGNPPVHYQGMPSPYHPHPHHPMRPFYAPPPHHSLGEGHPFHAYSPEKRFSNPKMSLFPPGEGLQKENAVRCTCKRSLCLKLYCQCFSSSTTCGPACQCHGCQNTVADFTAIGKARKRALGRNPKAFGKFESITTLMEAAPKGRDLYAPKSAANGKPQVNMNGCKCRRSLCLKKYCECFQHGSFCGGLCQCTGCQNVPGEDDSNTTTNLLPTISQSAGTRTGPITIADIPSCKDPMAIMAAVAMTELLSGKVQTNPEDVKESQKRELPKEEDTMETTPKKPRPSPEDDEVRAVVSLGPTFSNESRNPSPDSFRTKRTSPSGRAPSNSHPPYYSHPYRASPPPYRYPPPLHYHHDPMASPPPPPPYCASPHHYMMRASPPIFRPRPPSYEETLKTSGLPQSLSFRRICSKCGKTRSEHGDLGYGSKCVFQECGKCGAGIQTHRAVGEPMGVLCQLSVADGAMPGAAAAYDRKIRDLAAVADLEKEAQRRQSHAQVLA